MADFAFWQCLYTAGHDAACLTRQGSGWFLRGTALFRHEAGPACINYAVTLDDSWRTIRGTLQGYLADRPVNHLIERRSGHGSSGGWHLDRRRVDGLDHLLDLDYGFTPATNMQQLRRVGLKPGEAANIPVVWFDLEQDTLIELPQHYARLDETAYRYASPQGPYEAVLEVAPNGFASLYPDLWRMVA